MVVPARDISGLTVRRSHIPCWKIQLGYVYIYIYMCPTPAEPFNLRFSLFKPLLAFFFGIFILFTGDCFRLPK